MIVVRPGLHEGTHVSKSEDGGRTWTQSLRDTGSANPFRWPLHLYDIAYPTPDLAIVAADSGYVYRTSNGGRVWSKLRPLITSGPILRVSMFDESFGVAVAGYPNRLIKTTDGGLSWTEIDSTRLRPDGWSVWPIEDVCQTSPLSIVCSMRDTVYLRTATSSDGGNTWQHNANVLPGFAEATAMQMSFVDSVNGWATTRYRRPGSTSYRGMILRSRDGGLNWSVLIDSVEGTQAPTVGMIAFADTLNGIVDAFYEILRTRDGGLTWSVDADKDISGIARIAFKRGHPGIATAASDRIFLYRPSGLGIAGALGHRRDAQVAVAIQRGQKLRIGLDRITTDVARVDLYDFVGGLHQRQTIGVNSGTDQWVDVSTTDWRAGTYALILYIDGSPYRRIVVRIH
jgi:photosystem II stability/assembly factor-like uncharacterized protein